ncbi:MAG: XRE family transcriptional regulator [Thermoguttaceae bacterium]|jgi:transcriptional regulator with XRE-family HTH domain
MANQYRIIRERLSAGQLSQAEIQAKETIADMLLAEIRKSVGLTQEELAAALGITQPSLSKLENQDDMQVSTLHRLIQALGGELEIIAHLPRGDIRILQFNQTITNHSNASV